MQYYNILAKFILSMSAEQRKQRFAVLTMNRKIPTSALLKPNTHKMPIRNCGRHKNIFCKFSLARQITRILRHNKQNNNGTTIIAVNLKHPKVKTFTI